MRHQQRFDGLFGQRASHQPPPLCLIRNRLSHLLILNVCAGNSLNRMPPVSKPFI
jgi:hypothetical protein